MLNIIRSNRVEALLRGLAHRVSDAPLSSPFDAEVVVVPSPAMARWVNLQLALEHGVAANLAYPLPASFVWQVSCGLLDDLPEQDPLGLDVLVWKVFGVLPELMLEPAFEPLRHYLGEDNKGLKRYQLAKRIADVLDRYQLYRPELIRGWGAGKGGAWEALLWRRLTVGVGRQHRVRVIDRLLEVLAGPGPFPALPERLSLFAISSLPPLLVTVIHALAHHREVDLYLQAPTDAFWADLVSQKELARKRLEKPDEADLWEVGNSLLASWGRQGQALRMALAGSGLSVRAQVTGRYLLSENGRGRFGLRPDIGLYRDGQMQALLDTKWKRLFPDQWNFGIAQADMYQAYAYGKEYNVPQTLFVYPRWGSLDEAPANYCHGRACTEEQSFRIGIRTLDLSFPLGSLSARLRLLKSLEKLALDAVCCFGTGARAIAARPARITPSTISSNIGSTSR